MIDIRDGQSYTTVQIGTQCWMAENLNIGTMVIGTTDQSNNSIIEKYCYDNNTANCDVYGGLYQWNEMMQYNTAPGAQGICPGGWHLPTDAEWCILEQYVDTTIPCGAIGWRGVDGGGKLKEAGTIHWNSPNTGATNSSGFTALPGGNRYTDGSFFLGLGCYGYFWSSSENGLPAWYRDLNCGSAQVYRLGALKALGLSVRCLRDEEITWSCGQSFQVTHTAGIVAPVDKTVIYGTVQTNLTGSNKCWITQNLGSDHQAVSATDATEESAGWYWQFNRKQGYKHDGTIRTPNTTWNPIDENSDWLQSNDPCQLLLGNGWRLPTNTEWTNADANGGWNNFNQTFSSVLKLHGAGGIFEDGVSLIGRGNYGRYWSATQVSGYLGWSLAFSNSFSNMDDTDKMRGYSSRCIKD